MTEEPLKCPRDGMILDPRTYEANVEVDSCASCRGMWLDAGELEAIQESSERHHASSFEVVATDLAPVAPSDAPIACPVCGGTMEAREYAYCSGVVVDTCVEGCGVWLDAGEIQLLEAFFEDARKKSGKEPPLRGLWASLSSLFDR